MLWHADWREEIRTLSLVLSDSLRLYERSALSLRRRDDCYYYFLVRDDGARQSGRFFLWRARSRNSPPTIPKRGSREKVIVAQMASRKWLVNKRNITWFFISLIKKLLESVFNWSPSTASAGSQSLYYKLKSISSASVWFWTVISDPI